MMKWKKEVEQLQKEKAINQQMAQQQRATQGMSPQEFLDKNLDELMNLYKQENQKN